MHRTRVTRTNGSLSIEIPEDVLDTLGLHEGDEVDIGSTENGIVLVPTDPGSQLPDGVDPEFDRKVDELIGNRIEMLKALSRR